MKDFRDSAFEAVHRILSFDARVMVLTNDMGAMGLDAIRQDFPAHVVNMGIAEQNLMSVSAGLAMTGKIVFVYGIASHMTLRCLEQFRLDACAMSLPVILLGVGSGLAYGADGPTHHAVNDLGAMGSIPGLTILNPADAPSTSALVEWAYAQGRPAYIRLDKDQHHPLYAQEDFVCQPGCAVLKPGDDLMIISTGMMVHRAMEVAAILESEGIQAGVLDVFRLTPLNRDTMIEVIRQVPLVVTLEEHGSFGGLGTRIAELLVDHHLPVRCHRMGLPDQFFLGSSNRTHIHEHYGLSPDHICQTIRGLWKTVLAGHSLANPGVAVGGARERWSLT